MKKLIAPIAAICLILSGCGEGEALRFAELSEAMKSAESISMEAEVRAELDDRSCSFTLSYEKTGDEAIITVKEPEAVAGISARVKDGNASLEYDGAILDIGKLSDNDLSPMSALPYAVAAMEDGYVDLAWEDNGCLCVRITPEDGYTLNLRLDNESLTPEDGEIIYNDKAVIFIDILDWSVS